MTNAIKPTGRLRMDPVGGDAVVLERTDVDGAAQSITLSVTDVLHLAQNMSQFAARLLAAQHRPPLQKDPDLQVSVALEVKSASVNTDLHQSRVLLGFVDAMNAESQFALTPALARGLSGELARRAQEVETAPKPKN